MSTRQGSASYTIVIAAIGAVLIGGFMLTFLMFPIFNSFTNAAFWSASTVPGARLVTMVGGLWEFWGGIILLGILSFLWVRTRR